MKAEVVLTVSESKRLIAKGVAKLDFIRERMGKGIIVLTTGSTNAYVYEDLTGQSIDKRAYLSGVVTPAKGGLSARVKTLPDLVLVDGQPDPDLDRFSALKRMEAGDVYIKGANALNYGVGVAGVTVGQSNGGTVGGAMGTIIGKKLRLLIPIGLEKEVPFDIQMAAARVANYDETLGKVSSLWPIQGLVFTEIEALEVLCEVEAIPVGAGGIAGAEGAVHLLLVGTSEEVKEAVGLVKSIQGEAALK